MFPMLRSVLMTAGALCSAFALAQIQPTPPSGDGQNTAKYTVSGTVVNAVTGEPIRRALVRISGTSQAAAFTDESGHFQFADYPGGRAFVRAEKPGFFETGSPSSFVFYSGSNRFGGGMSSIVIGPDSKDIQIKLTPDARIEGRVTNSDGEPLEGVQVQVMGEQIVEGRKQPSLYAMASTMGSGHYLIGGLKPGKYFIHTLLQPVFGDQRMGQVITRNYPLAYPSVYYPEAADFASAQAQELKGGEDAKADFTLTPKQTFRITGTAAGAQNYLGIFLGEPGVGQPAHYSFDLRTSSFAMNLLAPGSYTLHFISQDMQGNQYSATQEVTIAGSDISDLKIVLQSGTSIPVDIQQPTSGGSTGNAQVRLISKEVTGRNGGYFATPQNGGSPGAMLIRNVSPGNYRVQVRASGSGCLESVTSGSANLLQDDLIVTGGAQPPPIAVVLGNDCGKLLGVVHSGSSGTPASVLLISDSGTGNPIVISAQPDGSFSSGAITPGSYRAYAFSSLQNLEYANPEALRDYSGQQVSLEPNQPVTVSLDLIERKE